MFWLNGGVVTSSGDVGLYDAAGQRLWSQGGVAQSGVNAMQKFNVAGIQLKPGDYYMALALNTAAAGEIFRSLLGPTFIQSMGGQQMGTAYPLPAKATFTNITGTTSVPVFGFTSQSILV